MLAVQVTELDAKYRVSEQATSAFKVGRASIVEKGAYPHPRYADTSFVGTVYTVFALPESHAGRMLLGCLTDSGQGRARSVAVKKDRCGVQAAREASRVAGSRVATSLGAVQARAMENERVRFRNHYLP